MFVFCCISLSITAQDNPQAQNTFINQDAQQIIDEWNIKHPTLEFHSSFKPYLSSTLKEVVYIFLQLYKYNLKNLH